MSINPITPEKIPIRFGRGATAEEVNEIKTAASESLGLQDPVNPQLCFVEKESAVPVWNFIQKWVGKIWNNFKRRWAFYKMGYGLFPKYIPDHTVVYTLKKYGSAEQANTALSSLKKTEIALSTVKKQMLRKAETEKRFRQQVEKILKETDTSQFGLSKSGLNPFSLLQPAEITVKTKKGTKKSYGPEYFLPTCQAVKVDAQTILAVTRLGPHV